MENKKDAYELSVEINAVSMILSGLANQHSTDCESLTRESLRLALFGASAYLDRIAVDVESLEINENK